MNPFLVRDFRDARKIEEQSFERQILQRLEPLEDEEMVDVIAALLQPVVFVPAKVDDRFHDFVSSEIGCGEILFDERPNRGDGGESVGSGDEMLRRRQREETRKENVDDADERRSGKLIGCDVD